MIKNQHQASWKAQLRFVNGAISWLHRNNLFDNTEQSKRIWIL